MSAEMENNEDCSSDMSDKHLIPSRTYAYGVYGPIRNQSHVGDEHQSEIPKLISKSDYLDYIKNPIMEETYSGLPSDFLIGLDIPIVWINRKVKNDPTADVSSDIKDSEVCFVPGCVLEPWSEVEKGSFVLGLYIFEKDFGKLKRFIESKKTGDISAYYYGDFYRSDEYKKWSESRRSRGKKCIMGSRIFSGLRQQELLCRLIPDASQEIQNSLMEVSREFIYGKITLEQYVFSLRNLVGIQSLVNAVAIGTGKPDLTGPGIEPTKQNQAIHIRPEIPIGKACSSLSSTEIIQFLTGDYRLSKARSNDIFWEAVWPRLLARGWHSEQPNAYNYANNGKHSLVFLLPGVKKFSRRLVKGDAYLDSVSDVLNKVASDPQLIELDESENGETETKLEEQEEENGFLEKPKTHCYLQPRGPPLGSVVMKFTVVDTSLSGGKIITLRELEPLKLLSRCRSDDGRSELVSSDESDIANTFLAEQDMIGNGHKPAKKQKISGERKLPEKEKECLNGSDAPILSDPARKVTKARKSRQENLGHHAKRRRRLTACSRVDSKVVSSHERDNIDDLNEHIGSSSQANNHKLSSNLSFSSRCSSIDTVDEQPQPQSMNLIDLNFPHITPEFGNGELGVDVKEERNGPSGLQKQSVNMVSPKEQDNGVSRRQSTRNRPPTARALEAIANGFLAVNTRKKGKEENVFRESGSRSRNSRGENGVISECSNGDASSVVKGDDENGPCNG